MVFRTVVALLYCFIVYPWMKQTKKILKILLFCGFIPCFFGLGLWHMMLRGIKGKQIVFLDTCIFYIPHNCLSGWKKLQSIEKYKRYIFFFLYIWTFWVRLVPFNGFFRWHINIIIDKLCFLLSYAFLWSVFYYERDQPVSPRVLSPVEKTSHR